MKDIEINYDKVKMKHYLHVVLDEDNDLDLEYALYEFIHVMKEKGWTEPKTFKQIKWGGFTYKTEQHSTEDILEMLVDKKWLKKVEERGHIQYKVIDHPWK